ncbi:hypothetical protein [Paracnuella aquatica]|uniref:hypothetical protein n=1 Tax=Paracnuella aquatica TaxID=2268757 RepID=UPI000DEFC928|nr:hypothetical protein [Paracnuella aquatica]RPD44218.1 hypothetical protein DRJ53_17705 [Paracnuella aquatica]
MRISLILMVALLLAGCQKENTLPCLEEISKDTRFQALIQFNHAAFKAAAAGTAHYGFPSQQAYEEAVTQQGENVRYVHERYRWEGHSRGAQLSAVVSTFKELKLYGSRRPASAISPEGVNSVARHALFPPLRRQP